jgi:sec-independent protein translocase protein TatB
MEILGIGWQELLFIVVIALIVLGPKDMQKAGRTIGRWLNQLVQSDSWKVFQQTSSELRNLPRNLMREANMEMKATEQEIRRAIDPRLNPPTSGSASSRSQLPSKETEKTAQSEPPAGKADSPAVSGKSGPALKGREEVGGAGIAQDSDEHV